MANDSLLGMFLNTADRLPAALALAAKVDGTYRPLTYAEVAARVRRFGAALVGLGIQPGDRVALFCENRPEWAIADLGTYAAGGVVVPVYATLPLPQVEHIVRDSGARVLVVSGADRAEVGRDLRARVPALDHVLVVGAPAPEGTTAFEGLLSAEADPESQAESDRRAAALTPDDLATLVYTSGTTGEPKGAMLTHGNILANLADADPVLRIDESDVFLSFLPLCHIFERMAGFYLALRSGAAIYFAESVYTVARNLPEVRPTLMMSVPRLFENIQARILDTAAKASPAQRRLFHWALGVGRQHSARRLKRQHVSRALASQHFLADRLVLRRIRQRTGGRIRYFVSGGAPLPPDTAAFFFALGLPVLQGYGLTETSPVIAVNPPADPRTEGVGVPFASVEVRIAEDGEICARGPSVMRGYWNRPDDTAAAIDAEGWFHTGDIGRVDEEGRLHITDRKKNILVLSTGKNVAPQMVETRLKASPLITEVILMGDHRAAVSALVIPDFEALRGQEGLGALSNQELAESRQARRLLRAEIDRLSEGLAEYERVGRFAVLDRELQADAGEVTPTLKPRRAVVLEHFADAVRSVYGE